MFGMIAIGVNVVVLFIVFSLMSKLDDVSKRLKRMEEMLQPTPAAPTQE